MVEVVQESSSGDEPPYLRIVADIRRRIADGELPAGSRVPSTRQIMREWDVAMATATKALSTLRQHGMVRAVRGSGTVVSEPAPARSPGDGVPAESVLGRDRVVRTAIRLADEEGLAAVSMRRVAAELDVGTMSLYRYVPDKDELIRLMADTAFGERPLPEPGPEGWRAKLELLARTQWAMYRRHLWLALPLLTSLTRPPVVASGMAHLDWGLRALGGLGLDAETRMHIVITLNGYVGGLAVTRAMESEAERDSGLSSPHRHQDDRQLADELLSSGRYAALREVSAEVVIDDLGPLFEFGLQRQLDGIASLLAGRSG